MHLWTQLVFDNLKAYINDKTSNDELNDALIDSAIRHIILWDKHIFIKKSSTWQTKNLMTIHRSKVFSFEERIIMIKLLTSSIIKYKHTLFVPSIPHSLISYQDKHANGYYFSTPNLDRWKVLVFV